MALLPGIGIGDSAFGKQDMDVRMKSQVAVKSMQNRDNPRDESLLSAPFQNGLGGRFKKQI